MSENANRARFERIARAYSTDLYRFGLWLCGDDALAKDLVQETFLRAWKAIGRLEDEDAAKSWLITILRREYARTLERKRLPMGDFDTAVAVVADEDELSPEERTERVAIREGIGKLAPKYREPLMLQVVMGLSCEEIAQALELSRSAVMTQLFRAREQLKETLQSDGVTGNVHGLF
jgi:RNA polymerase sigma-70 factor (ECF subfamily)